MNRTNFPGRKNRRRMNALAKLETVALPTFAQRQEIAALKRRIIPMAQALNMRSKKLRGTG